MYQRLAHRSGDGQPHAAAVAAVAPMLLRSLQFLLHARCVPVNLATPSGRSRRLAMRLAAPKVCPLPATTVRL